MGGSVGGGRGRRGGIVGINVTPMVDVMLVLLVIMMVSATYIVSRALKVELPKSASSDEAAQGPITVTLTKEHQTLVNQEPVSGDAELVARFQKARAAGGEPSVVVTATGGVLENGLAVKKLLLVLSVPAPVNVAAPKVTPAVPLVTNSPAVMVIVNAPRLSVPRVSVVPTPNAVLSL